MGRSLGEGGWGGISGFPKGVLLSGMDMFIGQGMRGVLGGDPVADNLVGGSTLGELCP